MRRTIQGASDAHRGALLCLQNNGTRARSALIDACANRGHTDELFGTVA